MARGDLVLYWVNGVKVSEQDHKDAEKLNARVQFRNARFVGSIKKHLPGKAYPCAGVAGCAPQEFVEAFGVYEGATILTMEESAERLRKENASKKTLVVDNQSERDKLLIEQGRLAAEREKLEAEKAKLEQGADPPEPAKAS